ncbi:hypothetical protein [Pedobacter xixiisoli]|uniref:Uncharacterized protein n=1 Tax=Pedobacter xixiisoli TaxID=1476464 RepID=A0A285ZWI4_9SPHI|nr:hypothetical protein [Pedobacter xixiisoli]SOD14000.1 hypothetical protein SAMN06297358_1352 [Pedobacter xixiisoli]
MEPFEISALVGNKMERLTVVPQNDAQEQSEYDVYLGSRKARIWTDFSIMGLEWHSADLIAEDTLRNIGLAIEGYDA